MIGEIDGIQDINLSSPTLEDNLVTAKCAGIDIKKSSSCFVCNSSLDTQETTETTEETIVVKVASICNRMTPYQRAKAVTRDGIRVKRL